MIYPSKNRQLPEFLRCRILFQDGSEHIYQVPTVRIQSYSLQEIHEKHLMIFIPYVLLRLRPKLNPKRKHTLTKKELTDFVGEAILILEDELRDGYLTEREFDDYINLFRNAAERIFKDGKHSVFRREVDKMTKPLIELPSVREKRLRTEIDALHAKKDAAPFELPSVREKKLRAENDPLRAKIDALHSKKDAALIEKDIALVRKDAELARLKELLAKHNIAITP